MGNRDKSEREVIKQHIMETASLLVEGTLFFSALIGAVLAYVIWVTP